MIKTKIIITYGPSIFDEKVLRRVLKHTDVVRFNMSHGDETQWLSGVKSIKGIAKELGKDIALLADLPGPKIRTGKMPAPLSVKKGRKIMFSYSKETEEDGVVPIDYPLHKDAKKGCVIDIGDGELAFHITAISGNYMQAVALSDGVIGIDKGVTLIGAHISASPPTDTDIRLAKFAKSNGFDFIAMSFVKSAANLKALREKVGKISLIAKIEKREAVEHIKEIVNEADGIMVARGDLAIEMNIIHIPQLQKKLIEAAREMQKPVIVATQLLGSMVNSPVPTRAEANDIASAVTSSVDCLMLSDETAAGKYPDNAVKFLADIIKVAEAEPSPSVQLDGKITNVNLGIAFATASLADRFKTDCIFIPTQTGTSAKIICGLRPNTRLISLAIRPDVGRSLAIYRGLEVMPIKRYNTVDDMFRKVSEVAKREHINRYIVISSAPDRPGGVDTLKYIERG